MNDIENGHAIKKGDGSMFNEIKTSDDIQAFLEKTNYLHDGYTINVQYVNDGITTEGGLYFEFEKTKLMLQVLVTSIENAVVEIIFEGVLEWQIKRHGLDGLFATAVTFDSLNMIIWSNDPFTDAQDLKTRTYVIAKSMRWRFVE